jgi:glycosyltransferase involved in cell wall biosynthesis
MGVRSPLRVLHPNLEPVNSGGTTASAAPSDVFFVGALHRPENHVGIAWFLDSVWPLVTARRPGATLVIAGANPPQSLLDRQSNSVTVTGFVPELAPYYASTSVFVAPLLSGAGLKFKVAQAMLHSLPVVTTPIGAEGFEEPGGDLFPAVTDDPAVMADAIARLLDEPELRARFGKRGREWALARFSFESGVDAVVADYLGVARHT